MGKVKKIQFIRPEIKIVIDKHILGRLYVAFLYFRLIRIVKMRLTITVPSMFSKYAGHGSIKETYCVCIPKIVFEDE